MWIRGKLCIAMKSGESASPVARGTGRQTWSGIEPKIRRAFTLIEVLCIFAILAILAGIFYPLVVDAGDVASAHVMSASVRGVREQVLYHSALGDTPLSVEGYPMKVEPDWFPHDELPDHAWTRRPLKIQVVHGGKQQRYPNNTTYQVKPNGDAAGHSGWYNASNGAFCALVPKNGSDAELLGLFNLVNGTSIVEDPAGGGGDGDDDDGHGRGHG